jgi:hypothetical protein
MTIIGVIQIFGDMEFKKTAWSKSFVTLYPKGPAFPDFSVLSFKAHVVKVHTMDHNAPFSFLTE